MKNVFLISAFVAIVLCVNAQVKVISNGNVGIGCIPSYNLDVNGTAFFGANYWNGRWGAIIGKYTNNVGSLPVEIPAIYGDGSLLLGTPDHWIFTTFTNVLQYNYLQQPSDIRLKENIKRCPSFLSKLKDVHSYNYNYTNEYLQKNNSEQRQEMRRTEYGFLAQELQKVFPDFVFEDENGMLSISYISMIPVLTSAINEMQQEAENRDSLMNAMQEEIKTLRSALTTCCNNKTQKSMQEFDLTGSTDANMEEMKVYQNAPNPFNESTVISCYIPETIKKAELCIYDMKGSRLKCLTVTDRGATNIQIQAGQLAAGVYTYLLIGDEKNSEAKQMILTK